MLSLLQASKCAETCMTCFSNCTNKCDVQIVETICFYTMIIVIFVAIVYGTIKFLPHWYTYKLEKLKATNTDKSNENLLTREEKERITFYEFCYTMAKSTNAEHKALAVDCWRILKKMHTSEEYNESVQNNEE